MKILYLTNYPSPYRVIFFNQLAKEVDLMVMYESFTSSERDKDWLNGTPLEHVRCEITQCSRGSYAKFATRFMKYVRDENYDLVVVGCYNSPYGIAAIAVLKACGQRFAINVDGEYFGSASIAKKVRDAIIKGADGYLIAGVITGGLLKKLVGANHVFPYRFSSLTEAEQSSNAESGWRSGSEILCVGQYAPYKGIDVLVDAMKYLPDEHLTIVGSSEKTEELEAYISACGVDNIRLVPFLPKGELGGLYQTCRAFVLPSRQECWGLVINEAASYGAPIVSTTGSGAALEFLKERYPQFLAEPDNSRSLASAIERLLATSPEALSEYSENLVSRSRAYSIEATVREHVRAFDSIIHGSSPDS